jgi:DivIVA domain-containing protein
MEMSPQTVRSTGFKVVKKGYDPAEVDAFKEQVASAVEYTQNQATAMEARARAAVAKLQELSQQVASAPEPAPAPAPQASADHEVISRTLMLAQRTADTTVAEAKAEADGIVAQARDEAGRVLDNARVMAAKTLDDARFESRRASEDEKLRAESEVQALLARRDFLLSDVDHLEQYVGAQRERLRDAAVQLHEFVDRVPGGLGEMRRPLMSASADPLPADVQPLQPEPAVQPTPQPVVDTPRADDTSRADVTPRADDTVHLDTAEFPAQAAEPAPLVTLALSPEPEAKDSLWRLLDDDTAEHDAVAPSTPDDPFHIAGDELQ